MFTPAHNIPLEVRKMASAVHEAGHAIVGVVLGRKVIGSMLRANGLSGETRFEPAADLWLDFGRKEDRETAENAIAVLYAGQIAEGAFWAALRSKYNPLIDSHYDDDLEIRRLIAAYNFSPGKETDYRNHCTAKARLILDDNRCQSAIKEIAAILVTAYAISRAELDEILIRNGIIS